MNYNLDIPGWMGVRDLQILKQIASHVPENGNILEVGCFLGRSTYALHDGKPASARIEVVDTFMISKLYSLDVGKSDIQGSRQLIDEAINIASKNGSWLESFKHCVTPEVAEQIEINAISSEEFNLNKQYDMVFIDANHSLNHALADITKFANPSTLLIGDDFIYKHLGLVLAIIMFRRDVQCTLIVPENSKIWIMVPTTGYWKQVFQTNILY